MRKLCCCCAEPEAPDISVNVTCACCESHVDERQARDSTDFTDAPLPNKEEEEDIVCCCFRRKRHANVKKKKNDKG